jgi:putative endonuclease
LKKDTIEDAIDREKQLKRWHRDWKINLIKSVNPEMIDLAADWYSEEEIEFHIRLIKKLNS